MDKGYHIMQIFADAKIPDKQAEKLTRAQIKNIKIYKKSRIIDITLQMQEIIQKSEIDDITIAIKKAYRLSDFKINICYYKLQDKPKYLEKYYESIQHFLKQKLSICRSLLADSKCRQDNDMLTIELSYGGADLLKNHGCHRIIEQLIREEFRKTITVKFIDKHVINGLEKPYDVLKQQEEKMISALLHKQNVAYDTTKNANKQKVTAAQPKQEEYALTPSNVIIGKLIKGESTKISQINEASGRVVMEGDIFAVDIREIRGERYIVSIDITDYKSSITAKFFSDKAKFTPIKDSIKEGNRIKVRGEAQYDKYARELVVFAYDIMQTQKTEKADLAPIKRVELHAHTHMSAMDGMCSVKELIDRAARWGHQAIAITDHGVVQAYPDAYDAGKKNNIKIIYGVECYLINDSEPIVYNAMAQSFDDEFVVFDIETTGLNAKKDGITEIGAVKIREGVIVDTYHTFVHPKMPIPEKIVVLTGITDEMVKEAPTIEAVLPAFLDFCQESVLVAHNASFDTGFIKINAQRLNLPYDFCVLDTLALCRGLFPKLKKHKLNHIAKHLDISLKNHHRAIDDAKATAHIFIKCLKMLREKGIAHIKKIDSTISGNQDVKKMPYYHAIVLVKNDVGLKNLYKLISRSHLEYFYKKPRIPKSLYLQYKEGLMIGSACEAGEMYRAILEGKPQEEVKKLVRFYDYLEIQPLGNNQFLIEKEIAKDTQQLKEINQQIVNLGEKYQKPVVATCDTHFLDPHDAIFRGILMAGQGYKDADNQAPLYFRNTEDMLAEFDYLDKKKRVEVVIDNPNRIADMIEPVIPIPEDTFTPEIQGAEQEMEVLSKNKAIKIYGDPLPPIVEERMNTELASIIKNGFSVMYIIAQKLVTKSLADGYLVGSRGSVGSSFVAFLTDITEVNALPPHYVCPHCKYSDFVTDGSVGCGFDMLDKQCPKCEHLLSKDGHDIPFATFLGFDGDKEPDIDLNFSGDYQPVAHKYTEELFGEGHVFRAGTIGTIAEKTAYGFVKKYLDEKNMVMHNAEINRMVKGCSGVKRTTGQHPGGVMIVPRKNEIYEFCPIQRPADDTNSNIITTHFDYHSISGRLLKLDILGHDDPTVIKMLEDLTGVDATKIPLDDTDTMKTFTGTDTLGIKPEDIGSEVGSFAIPEFGTKFVRQMLIDTKPKTFAELVRISGLSHGTDVWINNAQDLVRNNVATLPEVICTRDDIMVYLMHKGVESKHSFKIMENVRKGKGLQEEDEQVMREKNIPEWYIDSCKKIKYMFPKAHAVAYVTMAFRIAYFKVHYPQAFYIAYFTVRADDFDAMLMTHGVERVRNKIRELESKGNDISTKEKNTITILEVCNEMYSRGIDFLPIDLYSSDAEKFLAVEKGILPPLNALQGVGTAAARNIVESRKQGTFMSIDDLRIRAKASKTVIEILNEQGCLEGLPESNQLSLF